MDTGVVKDEWTGGYLYRVTVRGATVGGWAPDLDTAERTVLELRAQMEATHTALDALGIR